MTLQKCQNSESDTKILRREDVFLQKKIIVKNEKVVENRVEKSRLFTTEFNVYNITKKCERLGCQKSGCKEMHHTKLPKDMCKKSTANFPRKKNTVQFTLRYYPWQSIKIAISH